MWTLVLCSYPESDLASPFWARNVKSAKAEVCGELALPLVPVNFLMRDRKGVDPRGKEVGKN